MEYHGVIDFETIQVLLNRVKDVFNMMSVNKLVKKRVFNIMVECLENMLKHTQELSFIDYDFDVVYPKISINEDEEKFEIISQNTLLNKDIVKLKENIDNLNALDKERLKKHYENRIFNTKISNKGGAGLGLIDIVMKSENKIDYEFIKIDEVISIFKQRIIILKK